MHALARRSQTRCGAPVHENISWYIVDIAEQRRLAAALREVQSHGPIDYLVHLAAHYDFTGDDDPEYWRTNVDGLKYVLEQARFMDLKRFVFASSTAACAFPPAGSAIDEASPPSGKHVYAVTKKLGEEMLADYDEAIPSCIVRFAALFSDWCEYPPLYFFLNTWLAKAWNSRVLGGKGLSAIPYLHVRDAAVCLERILESSNTVEQREVFNISRDGATNHVELFEQATRTFFGQRTKPIFMPKLLCLVGVHAMDLLGRLAGSRPFERPWMMEYLDEALTIDSRRTRERLGWEPRERLEILRRIPFMLEHLKTDPDTWHQRNIAALKESNVRPHLRIYRLLEKHSNEIRKEFCRTVQSPVGGALFPSYQAVKEDVLSWRFTVAVRHLLNAIRTREKGIFMDYCRDLADKRQADGFSSEELCRALRVLGDICLRRLEHDREALDLRDDLHDHVTTTINFGCDQVLDTYEQREEDARRKRID